MNFFFGFLDKVTNIYQRFVNSNTTAENKRKRSSIDLNVENIPPKRLKIFPTCAQTENFIRRPPIQFRSRSDKIQSMTETGTFYSPSVRTALRPPQSWNFNMDSDVIEFSSDDEDNNDVQVIVEEPHTSHPVSRNPLSLIKGNGFSSAPPASSSIQVLKVIKKGKEIKHNGTQTQHSFHTSTPASVTSSHRKNGHVGHASNMKKSSFNVKNHCVDKPKSSRALTMAMNMDSKITYSALINSYYQHPSRPTSSFANLQDVVDKKLDLSKNSTLRSKTLSPAVKVIDLTESKGKRKPVHVPVRSARNKTIDDDSDIEVISVKPVPRVNSMEKKIREYRCVLPEWIENMQKSFKELRSETSIEAAKEKTKKDIFAERNKDNIDAFNERALRYMSITDDHVVFEVEEEVNLPELTEEMERRISSALIGRPPNEVIAEGFSLRITRKDMQTLANLNWLNDEVINFYMNLLIERGKKDKMAKVYAFNTFFYPTLIERGHASLRRWTRKIDIFSHDLIVVPVHLGVHWCVAIIDFNGKMVEYYDSMGHANNKCLNALLKYLQDESLDKKNVPYDTSSWQTKNMTNIPQQMNGSDCGMFACTFAEYKCRKAKINFSQENMPYFRRKMVYEILTGRLMMGNG